VAAITLEEGLGVSEEQDVVQYEALSYCWGRPELSANIFCDGLTVSVPPAMLDGLRHLRSLSKARWIWCDALCINQSDKIEKAKQVQSVLLIFAKAAKVIAWLGPLDSESDRAIILAELSRRYSRSDQRENEDDVRAGNVFRQIVQRKWFSRNWVRQEVYAARDQELQLGDLSLPFLRFLDMPQVLKLSSHALGSLSVIYNAGGGEVIRHSDHTPWEERRPSYRITQRFLEGA
jgi:hypothetical protein